MIHVVGRCVGRGGRCVSEEQTQIVALNDLRDLASLDIVYLNEGRFEGKNVGIV